MDQGDTVAVAVEIALAVAGRVVDARGSGVITIASSPTGEVVALVIDPSSPAQPARNIVVITNPRKTKNFI
jgi:hypothetical protein